MMAFVRNLNTLRPFSSMATTFGGHHRQSVPNFGILFDIDGVIMRGSKVLPQAPGAFAKLVDESGRFRVPTVFVTNAGNTLRQTKADQLSNWLGVEVKESQVVMSHSPLKMFKEYHDKHVLVVGQGAVSDIAMNLGFNKTTTMDQFRHSFPTLDAVDHKRRRGE
jgi:HAD superfamily hydrolase (TIGR01456 family)